MRRRVVRIFLFKLTLLMAFMASSIFSVSLVGRPGFRLLPSDTCYAIPWWSADRTRRIILWIWPLVLKNESCSFRTSPFLRFPLSNLGASRYAHTTARFPCNPSCCMLPNYCLRHADHFPPLNSIQDGELGKLHHFQVKFTLTHNFTMPKIPDPEYLKIHIGLNSMTISLELFVGS